MNFLDDLNENQRQAVEFVDGASLVIAGAGSGKTRVLTYKIAYLLQKGLPPSSLLALTFTNKAAREMRSRIEQLVGPTLSRHLWMGTFHSIFSKILRSEADKLGYSRNFTIYDSSDSKSLIKSIIKELKLDDKVYKHGMVASRISFAKNNLITPESYKGNDELTKNDMNARVPRVSEVYRYYAERCKLADAMDFDDLLLQTNVLFRDFPEVLAKYRDRFNYILVDEYQDTNYAQYLIVKKLSEGHERICVVGDDAQSIYSFRGANIDNILQFQNNYRTARIFKLEQNYRSTQNIVNAANSLIDKNKDQIRKTIFSEKPEGHLIKVMQVYSDLEEGSYVAGQINELKSRENYNYNEIAILYRTNSQSRVLEDQMRKDHVPYKIYGGLSFYQRKEIKDLIAYFRLMINPSDEEALKRIINYPARGIGDTTVNKLLECALIQSVSAWDVMGDVLGFNLNVNNGTANKLKSFRQMIEVLAESAKTLDAYEVAQQVVKTTGIISDTYVDRSPEAISRQENIQELVKAIHEFCENRRALGDDAFLPEFLAEISLLTDQDTDGDDKGDKVTLMTVHAAKGLEFRVVFVVGMEEELFPSLFAMETARELEEERRLFYVALTRAEERCFISYAKSRFRNGKVNFSNPSRFIRDIDDRYLDKPMEFSKPSRGSIFDDDYDFESERKTFGSWSSGSSSRGSGSSGSGAGSGNNHGKSWPSAGAGRSAGSGSSSEIQSDRLQAVGKKFVKISSTPKSTGTAAPQVGADAANPAGNTRQSNVGSINPNLPVGQKVRHAMFGDGTVLTVTGMGTDQKAEIDFGVKGMKTLLLKFAKLEKI